MVINTQQLQYLVEIERTGSISQAAANLYIGQPHLSRILRTLENSLGYAIFDRTRQGVRVTDKGAVFLQHAQIMLREAECMELLGPNSRQTNRFRICIPRSYQYLNLVQEYLRTLSPDQPLDVIIRECHPMQAIDLLEGGSVELAIIRYCPDYQGYFAELTSAKQLSICLLSQTEYQVTVSTSDVLSLKKKVSVEDLSGRTEILHRDSFSFTAPEERNGQIYAVDRLAQIQMLQSFPGAYLWSEPLPHHLLRQNYLVQKICPDCEMIYQNALLYKPNRAMSSSERMFLNWLKEQKL